MIDAYVALTDTEFPPCETGNSFERMASMLGDVSPYTKMWGKLETLHGTFGWNDMCDPELDAMWNTAIMRGFTVNGVTVSADDVRAAAKRWDTNRWFRYEYKRDQRRKSVFPWMRVAAIA